MSRARPRQRIILYMLDPAAYGRSISGIVESLTQAVVQEKTRAEMAELQRNDGRFACEERSRCDYFCVVARASLR